MSEQQRRDGDTNSGPYCPHIDQHLYSKDEYEAANVKHPCGDWESFVRDNMAGGSLYARLIEDLNHRGTAKAVIWRDKDPTQISELIPTNEVIVVQMPHYPDFLGRHGVSGDSCIPAGTDVRVCRCGKNHVNQIR